MAKTVKVKEELPHNYRTITAGIILGVFLLSLLTLGLLGRDILEKKERSRVEKEALLSEQKKWGEIIEKYPDYRDAYYQGALIEYRLGNKRKAGELVTKALSVDPNFKAAIELKQQIWE